MRRREFIAGLGGAVAVGGRGQQPDRVRRSPRIQQQIKSPANRTGQRNAFKSGASGGYYFVRWEGGA
jgi:hypothetical protein